MPLRRFCLVLAVAATAAGCGDDETEPVPADAAAATDAADAGDETPVTPLEALDTFCTDLNRAVCDQVARCGCGGETEEACRTGSDVCWPGAPALRSALGAGLVELDLEAARALVERIDSLDASRCEGLFDLLDLRVADALTFADVVTGKVAAGLTCTDPGLPGAIVPSSCADGACIGATCRPVAGPGDPCDAETLCLFLDWPYPGVEAEASVVSRCLFEGDEEVGTCLSPQPVGELCEADHECESGFCNGRRCGAQLADGDLCILDSDCVSGFCDILGDSSCAPSRDDGEACSVDAGCESGFCDQPESSGQTGICTARLPLDQPCTAEQPNECQSGACGDDVCVEPICVSELTAGG